MGQRLNIEIVSGGRTLANAYYHWSAYSASAADLAEQILSKYESDEIEDVTLDVAVDLLHSTGAGFDEQEIERMKNNRVFLKYTNTKAINRNTGLLSITDEGIEETRYCEEGRVSLDFDSKTVCFDVYFTEEDESEFKENFNMGFQDLPMVDMFDMESIPFDRFYELSAIISENPNGIRTGDGTVVSWIS